MYIASALPQGAELVVLSYQETLRLAMVGLSTHASASDCVSPD
ncbi:hypothetical protein [Microbulbifer rhizosphaerae]|uniref:Uncharacterized protein n=1 Tax=Microbulbifer rhizosphaerae TaxID=1562603 RepID=A0A7W4W8Q8_9GAMM|nr:hypothetical protein [Microbulbifer rhizosphaerae]MBB3059777.1 hypothetical protein [Microbulbifer rhizosphaerae]